MKPNEKFKLCPSCDGKAPIEVVICPYCASSFNEPGVKNKTSISQNYSPPYSAERQTTQQIQKPSVKPEKEMTQEATISQEKSVFLPIALLIIGSNLLILSLLLLILSHNGKVVLEWNADFWMLYGLLSIPLLYVGYKIIKKDMTK